MRILSDKRGMGVLEVIVGAAVLIFVIMPVFSIVIEKYLLIARAQTIKDAIDITNIATYTALSSQPLSRCEVEFDTEEAQILYNSLLAKNLFLEEDLSPRIESAADGQVVVESLILYSEGFPITCPNNTIITRPTIHSCVIIPVKPGLYRQIILGALGKEFLELRVHVDSEIPINN